MTIPRNVIPQPDEILYLLLRVVEQAIRDYLSLDKAAAPIEKEYYDTACQFLFDDEYVMEFGGANKTLKEILEMLEIEVIWFREKVIKLKQQKHDKINILKELNEKG